MVFSLRSVGYVCARSASYWPYEHASGFSAICTCVPDELPIICCGKSGRVCGGYDGEGGLSSWKGELLDSEFYGREER